MAPPCRCVVVLLLLASPVPVACAGGGEGPRGTHARPVEEGGAAVLPETAPALPDFDAGGTYLAWNTEDADGTPAFVHVTPDDMPLRIAIARPPVSARDGSTADTRRAAIEGMRVWEEAIRPALPWFSLAFVERDDEAPVQVRWMRGRRAGGSATGRGGIAWRVRDGRLEVGGGMRLAVQPHAPYSPVKLTLDEIRLLVAHEFGHVLGLGHCLDCDSVMNYSWETRERALVTPLDVATFLALVAQPNGLRADGRYLESVAAPDEATAGP